MAKKSKVVKEQKRREKAARYAAIRKQLKENKDYGREAGEGRPIRLHLNRINGNWRAAARGSNLYLRRRGPKYGFIHADPS
ncbi:30S ribosomal protein S14 [Paenibacillus sp. strain BS8-2]